MVDTKKPEQVCKPDGPDNNAELLFYKSEYTVLHAKLKLVNEEAITFKNSYEHILWLYAEGICRAQPERLDYLMSVELPFHLKLEVLNDLEVMVNHILNERQGNFSLKVAA